MIRTFSSYAVWAFFAACNLAVAPLMGWIRPEDWGALFVYLCLGTIPAQAGLLAIWFVLWPQASFSRMASCSWVATVLFVFWAMGYILAEVTPYDRSLRSIFDEMLLVLLCLPVFQLAAQSPLWFARAVLRWRIDQPGASGEGLRQGNLTIRGILIGTGLIALSLALAKAAQETGPGMVDKQAWFALGIGVLSVACIGLVILPPALLAVLRARSPWLGSILFLIYVSVAMVSVLTLCRWLGVPLLGTDSWRMFGLFFSVLSTAALLCIALLETRRRGLRLGWGRERDPPPA